MLIVAISQAFAVDPAEYNDTLVEIEYRFVQQLNTSVANLGVHATEEEALTWSVDVANGVRDAIAHVEGMPPYKGDDSLRQALLKSLNGILLMFTDTFPKLVALQYKEQVSTQDLEEAERLTAMLMAESERLDDESQKVQEAFAKRHRLILIETEPPPAPEFPSFEVDGCVPAGSQLDCTSYVDFAVRYDNMALVVQNDLVDDLNRFVATGSGYEQARIEAVDRMKANAADVNGFADWRGDPTYVNALKALHLEFTAALDGPAAVYSPLMDKAFLLGGKRKLANENLDVFDAQVDAALDAFESEMEIFRQTFHINTYMAWAERTF